MDNANVQAYFEWARDKNEAQIKERAAQRRLEVVRLRNQDLTWKEIGKILGVCGARASQLFYVAQKRGEA
jgi:DNA-directed RNA polymerase specialized sigma subunit